MSLSSWVYRRAIKGRNGDITGSFVMLLVRLLQGSTGRFLCHYSSEILTLYPAHSPIVHFLRIGDQTRCKLWLEILCVEFKGELFSHVHRQSSGNLNLHSLLRLRPSNTNPGVPPSPGQQPAAVYFIPAALLSCVNHLQPLSNRRYNL